MEHIEIIPPLSVERICICIVRSLFHFSSLWRGSKQSIYDLGRSFYPIAVVLSSLLHCFSEGEILRRTGLYYEKQIKSRLFMADIELSATRLYLVRFSYDEFIWNRWHLWHADLIRINGIRSVYGKILILLSWEAGFFLQSGITRFAQTRTAFSSKRWW